MEMEKPVQPNENLAFVTSIMRNELLQAQMDKWDKVSKDTLQAILSDLSLDDKASLCAANKAGATTALPSLSVPSIQIPCGKELLPDFPDWTYLSGVWNRESIEQIAMMAADRCIGEKCALIQVPFERYPEGPTLAGEYAVQFINDVQQRGIGATLRFANDNSDTAFDELSIDQDAMRAFERVILLSQPWVVLLRSNPTAANIASRCYLAKTMKSVWGFLGLIAFETDDPDEIARGFASGMDLNIPIAHADNYGIIRELALNGRLSSKHMDQAVERILRVVLMSLVGHER